ALRRHELERCLARCVWLLDAHLHALEFRQVPRDRIRELNPTLLEERQGTDRDERLGHGGDAEDRIHLHGRAGLGILHPDRVGMDDLAVAGDEHYYPRNLSFLHVDSRQRRELLEAGGGDSVCASIVATLSRSAPDENRNGQEAPCETLERWH